MGGQIDGWAGGRADAWMGGCTAGWVYLWTPAPIWSTAPPMPSLGISGRARAQLTS